MPVKDGNTAKNKTPKVTNAPKEDAPVTVTDDLQKAFDDGQRYAIERIKTILDARYRKLKDDYDKEMNVGRKFELKIQMEELGKSYNELFGGN